MNALRKMGIVSLGLGISKLIYAFTFILIARTLNVSSYGSFIELIAFSALFINLFDFGLSTLTVRELPQSKVAPTHYFFKVYLAKTIPTAIAYVALIFISSILYRPDGNWFLASLIGLNFVFVSYQMLADSYFYAIGKHHIPSIMAIIQKVLNLLFVVVAINNTQSIESLAFAMLSASLISTGIITIKLVLDLAKVSAIPFKEIFPRALEFIFYQKNSWGVQSLLKDGGKIAIVGIITSAYVRIDIIILGRLTDNLQAGIYGAAYRIFDILLFVGLIYRLVVYPMASQAQNSNPKLLSLLTLETVRIGIFVLIPFGALLWWNSDFLIQTILGSQYQASAFPLRILCIAIPFAFVNNALLHFLLTVRGDSQALLISIAAIILNLSGNLILIPLNGYLAPAWMTVATECFVTIAILYSLSRKVGFKLTGFTSLNGFLAVVIPIILVEVVPIGSVILKSVLFVGLILASLTFFRVPNKIEISLLRTATSYFSSTK